MRLQTRGLGIAVLRTLHSQVIAAVLNIDYIYVEVFGVVADKCEAVMEKSFASRIARGKKALVVSDIRHELRFRN